MCRAEHSAWRPGGVWQQGAWWRLRRTVAGSEDWHGWWVGIAASVMPGYAHFGADNALFKIGNNNGLKKATCGAALC